MILFCVLPTKFPPHLHHVHPPPPPPPPTHPRHPSFCWRRYHPHRSHVSPGPSPSSGWSGYFPWGNAPAFGRCTRPIVRKEWRTLAKHEQLSYIKAVQCLQAKPSQLTSVYSGARSRYDDYQAVHIAMTERIHFVGQFLPWHRRFLALYESDLRTLCSYRGAQPYWDWTLDVGSKEAFLASPVFDSKYGFGGNGAYIANISTLPITSLAPDAVTNRTGGGCVSTGPFANLSVSLGPGNSLSYTPHCLRRDFVPDLAVAKLSQAEVDREASAASFAQYDRNVQIQALFQGVSGMTTHPAGHFGVGGLVGDMSDMWSSPGDPLFWLHHAKVDGEWDRWQRLDWPARKSDIGGPDTMWGYPYNFFVDPPYKNITLDFVLAFPNLAGNVTVRDVMDIKGGALCYEYA